MPVVTELTAAGLQGTSFIPFGVQLAFTPFITDKDRIRLVLNASVSARDVAATDDHRRVPAARPGHAEHRDHGGNAGRANAGDRRPAADEPWGQHGARAAVRGHPLRGPVFRVDNTSASESELVLLVTPQLVHPMEHKEGPDRRPDARLPRTGEPANLPYGRLESQREYDYRSPVMDEISRMAAYRHCEVQYFNGPHGHSDGQP